MSLVSLTLLAPSAVAEEIVIQECDTIGGGGRCLENRDVLSVGSHLIEDDVVICADVFVGCAEE